MSVPLMHYTIRTKQKIDDEVTHKQIYSLFLDKTKKLFSLILKNSNEGYIFVTCLNEFQAIQLLAILFLGFCDVWTNVCANETTCSDRE